MTAFNHKFKKMPSIENQTTMQLLAIVESNTLQPGLAALNELKAREIKQGDSDNTAQVKGGLRPEHVPRVP